MRPNNSIIRCIEEETGPLFVISARAVVFLHSLPFLALFLAFVYTKHGTICGVMEQMCECMSKLRRL